MYELPLRIRYSEIDPDGYLSITGLMNILQDCASMHSEDIGYGLSYLRKNGLGWYVISWQIHIMRMPFLGEHITVKTAAESFRSFMTERCLVLEDENGQELVRVHSIWVLMNLKKGVPSKCDPAMVTAYGTEGPIEGDWKGRKLSMEQEGEEQFRFMVSPVMIDTNHHLNNSWYVSGAAAALPADFSVGSIFAEYKTQAKRGDEILVSSYYSEEDPSWHMALHSEDGTVYSIVEFYEKKAEQI